jgi:hypothetical protein
MASQRPEFLVFRLVSCLAINSIKAVKPRLDGDPK